MPSIAAELVQQCIYITKSTHKEQRVTKKNLICANVYDTQNEIRYASGSYEINANNKIDKRTNVERNAKHFGPEREREQGPPNGMNKVPKKKKRNIYIHTTQRYHSVSNNAHINNPKLHTETQVISAATRSNPICAHSMCKRPFEETMPTELKLWHVN